MNVVNLRDAIELVLGDAPVRVFSKRDGKIEKEFVIDKIEEVYTRTGTGAPEIEVRVITHDVQIDEEITNDLEEAEKLSTKD